MISLSFEFDLHGARLIRISNIKRIITYPVYSILIIQLRLRFKRSVIFLNQTINCNVDHWGC